MKYLEAFECTILSKLRLKIICGAVSKIQEVFEGNCSSKVNLLSAMKVQDLDASAQMKILLLDEYIQKHSLKPCFQEFKDSQTQENYFKRN